MSHNLTEQEGMRHCLWRLISLTRVELQCRSKLKGMSHNLMEQDLLGLAVAAHGFVGADLAALAQEASLTALRRIITARTASSSNRIPPAGGPFAHIHTRPASVIC